MRLTDSQIEIRRRRSESVRGGVERRALADAGVELREANDGTYTVQGYAALFNTTYDVGTYKERIAPTAFARTLQEQPDAVFNADHGRSLSGLPLARTRSAKGGPGTLTLRTDDRGLHFAAVLDADDPDSQALARAIRNGTMNQCSFAFRCNRDSWDAAMEVRTLEDVTLHGGDVSCVAFGANPATTISVRSAAAPEPFVVDPERRARERLALARRRDLARAAIVVPADPFELRRARLEQLRGGAA